jgi:hypothetical protein
VQRFQNQLHEHGWLSSNPVTNLSEYLDLQYSACNNFMS